VMVPAEVLKPNVGRGTVSPSTVMLPEPVLTVEPTCCVQVAGKFAG
jgi:hypothetical protein